MKKGGVMGKEPRKNDQFFTKPAVAKQCVAFLNEKFPLDDFSLIVEPSSGDNAFVDAIARDVTWMDIDALDADHRRDFFSFSPDPGNHLVIGNPPFGRMANMAIRFFNHAAAFADVIAFVVPRSFRKTSITNQLDLNFELSSELPLQDDSFIFCGKSYDVPCTFQIWKKVENARTKCTAIKATRDFKCVSATEQSDVGIRRVGINAGRVYRDTSGLSRNSHIFVQVVGQSVEKVVENLLSLKLEACDEKFNVAGQPSLSASEICCMYTKKFE